MSALSAIHARLRPWLLLLAAIAFGGLVTLAVGSLSLRTQALRGLEYWSGDWRSALLADRAPSQHPDIAVVIIDDDAVSGLPYRSPLDRDLLARLVGIVDGAGARVIGLDILFDQATEPDKDSRLLAALRAARARIVLGTVDARVRLKPERRAYLDRFLTAAGSATGYLNLRYEIDGVVRAEAESHDAVSAIDAFAARIAQAAGEASDRKVVPRRADAGDGPSRIAWLGKPADGTEALLVIPASALLATASEGEHRLALALQAQLRDRVVLVGGDLSDIADRHPTPLSKVSDEQMPGVVIHAHVVAQYLDGRSLHRLPPAFEIVSLYLLSIAGFLLGWRFHRTAMTMGSAPMLLLAALDAIVFTQSRTILPFASLALAWFFSVICGRGLRWLFEHRRTGFARSRQQI